MKKPNFHDTRLSEAHRQSSRYFFMLLCGHVNVFSIVAWDINNRGDGARGRLYQVCAYHFDENGMLVENKRVSKDDSMTGVEGYVEGRESKFRYRTASDVMKYWRSKQRWISMINLINYSSIDCRLLS
ncbi:hypothetical protein [Burkholderia sp. F1]|uniref:hypothetical protein n=1 Tax=Burkholderia sp. F1 TaxID=3366817 RepID=UPI003D752875